MKHFKVNKKKKKKEKEKEKSTTLKIKLKVIAGLVGVMEDDRKVGEVVEGKYNLSYLVEKGKNKEFW